MMKYMVNSWVKVSKVLPLVLTGGMGFSGNLMAADYSIDPEHSFVEFRIQHLGYSWLYGSFSSLAGSFSHDSGGAEKNMIHVEIDTASIDTNHAERDKHLRSDDFLAVNKFPKAVFTATGYSGSSQQGMLTGTLTLHGTTKHISIEVTKVGEGDDPWGGYRAGFVGTLELTPSEFGLDYDLGPASTTLEMELAIEGTRN